MALQAKNKQNKKQELIKHKWWKQQGNPQNTNETLRTAMQRPHCKMPTTHQQQKSKNRIAIYKTVQI